LKINLNLPFGYIKIRLIFWAAHTLYVPIPPTRGIVLQDERLSSFTIVILGIAAITVMNKIIHLIKVIVASYLNEASEVKNKITMLQY